MNTAPSRATPEMNRMRVAFMFDSDLIGDLPGLDRVLAKQLFRGRTTSRCTGSLATRPGGTGLQDQSCANEPGTQPKARSHSELGDFARPQQRRREITNAGQHSPMIALMTDVVHLEFR